MCGTTASPSNPRISRRISRQYTLVPTKAPSVTWATASSMNVRTSRGPYCELVRLRVTIVIENTTPVTVTQAPAIVETVVWPAETVVASQADLSAKSSPSRASTAGTATARTTATTDSTAGVNQKLPRKSSQR